MTTKKIVTGAVATMALAVFALAIPAGASAGSRACRSWGGDKWNKEVKQDNDTVKVNVHNHAYVSSTTVAYSSTGGNKQSWNDDKNHLKTGDAFAAAYSENNVNQTHVFVSVD